MSAGNTYVFKGLSSDFFTSFYRERFGFLVIATSTSYSYTTTPALIEARFIDKGTISSFVQVKIVKNGQHVITLSGEHLGSVGESALLARSPRTADAIAEEPTECMRLDRSTFYHVAGFLSFNQTRPAKNVAAFLSEKVDQHTAMKEVGIRVPMFARPPTSIQGLRLCSNI